MPEFVHERDAVHPREEDEHFPQIEKLLGRLDEMWLKVGQLQTVVGPFGKH